MVRVFIRTFGCSLNVSDSETIAGILKKSGFEIVKTVDSADVLILNSCTVKESTETRFFNYLSKLPKKPTIIAGCLSQTAPEKLPGYSLIGVEQLESICEVLEETLNGHIVTLIARERNERLNLPRIRKNPIVEIIPICRGCVGNCAYCKAKLARGDLLSYDPDAIIQRAREAVSEGVREIWITAQDTGAYGLDFKEVRKKEKPAQGEDSDLGADQLAPNQSAFIKKDKKDIVCLLRELCGIEGNFLIRLGMANPDHIRKIKDELIEVFRHKRMFKFLHIPVQSGSNRILKKMNRRYTIAQFKEIISAFRNSLPKITIATDIICGYPGETKEQFKESVDLINEIKPDVLNISRFSRKEGTPAAEAEGQLHSRDIKERSRAITRISEFITHDRNLQWLGWEGNIIIDQKGKDNTWLGRNFAYKQVVLEGDYRIGEIVPVKIHARGIYDLKAKPITLI